MAPVVEFVLPPVKYWSARKVFPFEAVYAGPPALMRTAAGVPGAAVVKLQLVAFASAVPSAALTAVVIVAVYEVELARAAVGVSVAVWLGPS